MELSIICVNWNSVDYLRDCLKSIFRWTHNIAFEVIVVDNASPSGDVDVLKREFPTITLIKSAINLGFAGANNLAVHSSHGEYILFLNPDTLLVSPAINVLLHQFKALLRPGVMGCKLLNADGSVQTSCIMHFPTILNMLCRCEYLRVRWPRLWGIAPLFVAHSEAVPVEAVSGACMLLRREIFNAVGMFSAEYFMYAEDLDLCYTLRRAGYTNYYSGHASIVHYGGTSSDSDWQTVVKIKAELRFCEKHYGHVYGLVFRMGFALSALVRLTLIAVVSSIDKRNCNSPRFHAAWKKWSTSLRTLVTDRSLTAHPVNVVKSETMRCIRGGNT
jgi:GT2 family glycosyltransferase